MIIAKCGNFLLTHKTYLNDVAPTTHNIEIRKQPPTGNQFTIADFDSEGQIRSCLDRLLTEIDNEEDLDNIRCLAHMAWLIISRSEKVSAKIDRSSDDLVMSKTFYHASFNDENLLVHDKYFEVRKNAVNWLVNNIVEMCKKLAIEETKPLTWALEEYCGVTTVEDLTAVITEGQDIEDVGFIEEVTLD